jgi:TonB family protein
MHPAVARSLLARKPLRMRGFLIASVIAHGLLLIAIVASSYLRLSPAIDLNQQPIKASLVRLGKPRDEKLLPRKEEPPPPSEEPVKEAPPVPKLPEPKRAVAIPDAKAEASRKSGTAEKSAADRRKELLSALSRTSKGAHPEELEGQPDGDPGGDSATAEGERYFGLLRAQIQRNYDVSQTIPEQERMHLKAQVAVLIGRSGEVLRVQLSRSSGNQLFDSSVLAAVKKASPFSPPPDHLRDPLQRRGIALEFRP